MAVERITEYINVENEVRRNQRNPGTRPKKKKKKADALRMHLSRDFTQGHKGSLEVSLAQTERT